MGDVGGRLMIATLQARAVGSAGVRYLASLAGLFDSIVVGSSSVSYRLTMISNIAMSRAGVALIPWMVVRVFAILCFLSALTFVFSSNVRPTSLTAHCAGQTFLAHASLRVTASARARSCMLTLSTSVFRLWNVKPITFDQNLTHLYAWNSSKLMSGTRLYAHPIAL